MIDRSERRTQPVLPLLTDEKKSVRERWRAFVPYLGPAFLVSVGYMDPGNWSTNLAGGATYGYALLWVLLLSNLMALLLQTLAAKLGIVTGRTLAENCREQFSRPVAVALWLVIEAAMFATDLAEFLGASLGFQILFHIPLFPAALLTGLVVFLILGLYRFGFRSFEAAVIALVATIGVCYVIEIAAAHDLIRWPSVLVNVFVPTLPPRPAFAPQSQSSLLVAIGMLGATVMPHNLFLHSGVVHTRVGQENNVDDPADRDRRGRQRDVHTRKVVHFALLDSFLALNIAWLVNSAMIVMAAAVFFRHHIAIQSITQAYSTLEPLLGHVAPYAFGVALLAAGLSSSVTGTLAGQMVMSGFLNREIPLWAIRLLTMVPALVIIYLMPRLGWHDINILNISQVCLSFALPFAVIPLLMFTRRKDLMREHTNRPATNLIAYFTAAVIIVLNVLLLWQSFGGAL